MPINTTAAPHQDEAAYKLIPRQQDGSWFLFEEENMKIFAVALKHRVPSLGFVIQEGPLPGKLDAAKLIALGVPQGPLFAKIKSGDSIEHNGVVINPVDVLGPERQGRKVVILGKFSFVLQVWPNSFSSKNLIVFRKIKLSLLRIMFQHSACDHFIILLHPKAPYNRNHLFVRGLL